MSSGLLNLNNNRGVLQSISASSSAELVELLQIPRLPLEIISIVHGPEGYTAFFRSKAIIKKREKTAERAE